MVVSIRRILSTRILFEKYKCSNLSWNIVEYRGISLNIIEYYCQREDDVIVAPIIISTVSIVENPFQIEAIYICEAYIYTW